MNNNILLYFARFKEHFKKILNFKFLGFFALLILLAYMFQNCSNVKFSTTGYAVNGAPKASDQLPIIDDDDPVPPDDTVSDDPLPPDDGDDNTDLKKACTSLPIDSVIVNIDHVEIYGLGGEKLSLAVSGTKALTSPTSLVLTLSKGISMSGARIVLKADGNMLSAGGVNYLLKTPSAVESGLKINLQGHQQLSAGANELVFEFDSTTQIVRAGRFCILKPVFKLISARSL